MASPTPTGSTEFWPPDWSQMFPDLLVALVTGLAVGIAILLVDRLSARRRNARKIRYQRNDARFATAMMFYTPFKYLGSNLLPVDTDLRAAAEAVRKVERGKPDAIVPGYYTLLFVVSAWERLNLAADEVEWRLNAYAPEYGARRIARARLQVSLAADLRSTIVEYSSLPKRFLRAINADGELKRAVGWYLDMRNMLEAGRLAHIGSVAAFEERAVPVRNYLLHNSIGPLDPNRIVANWRLHRAAVISERVGEELIKEYSHVTVWPSRY